MYRLTHFRPMDSIRAVSLYLCVFSALLLGSCQTAQEQSNPKRIGILLNVPFFEEMLIPFKDEMEKLGYVDGQNVVYTTHKIYTDPDQENEALTGFVQEKMDMIVTIPTGATIHAKKVTDDTDIPIVFGLASIEDTDLISSITNPGKNLTGVRFPGPDIAAKKLDILLQVKPGIQRILIPHMKGYPNIPPQLRAVRSAAKKKNVTLVEAPVTSTEELAAFIVDRTQGNEKFVDAVLLLAEPLSVDPDCYDVYSTFAKEHNIPLIGTGNAGGDFPSLLALVPDIYHAAYQMAVIADKILKGTHPSSVPVLSPNAQLFINLDRAERLNITIPEEILQNADHLIRE